MIYANIVISTFTFKNTTKTNVCIYDSTTFLNIDLGRGRRDTVIELVSVSFQSVLVFLSVSVCFEFISFAIFQSRCHLVVYQRDRDPNFLKESNCFHFFCKMSLLFSLLFSFGFLSCFLVNGKSFLPQQENIEKNNCKGTVIEYVFFILFNLRLWLIQVEIQYIHDKTAIYIHRWKL